MAIDLLHDQSMNLFADMSAPMQTVGFYHGDSELHGFLDCRTTISTAAIERICPISSSQNGCRVVGAWIGVDPSVLSSLVLGPYNREPMWWYIMMSKYGGPVGKPLSIDTKDIKLLKDLDRSTLILLGVAIGFYTVLAASIIVFLLYRRLRRRAMDRGRPRALSPPTVVAPIPSSSGVRGKDTRQPQTPIPATGDINPENERVWEALVALRNEMREMREGNIAETLPEYEPRDPRADS